MREVCAIEEGLQFVKKKINNLNHKQGSSIIDGMKRFWFALALAIFFYTKMDILIWQRIFEEHKLIGLGVGVYQWGWLQSSVWLYDARNPGLLSEQTPHDHFSPVAWNPGFFRLGRHSILLVGWEENT